MARCSACGAELAPGARFCSMCGRPVAGSPPAAEPLLPPSRPRPDEPPRGVTGGTWPAALALIGALALVLLAVVGRGRVGRLALPAAVPLRQTAAATILAPIATPPPTLQDYQELRLDVPAGGSYTLTFARWPAGAVFQGYFVAAAALDFRVELPEGGDLAALQHVSGRYDFRYTAPEAGQYAVVFANSAAPLAPAPLTLVYRAALPTP